MNTIGVVGLGFVGTAVWEGMKHAFNLVGYDKVKGFRLSVLNGKDEFIDISARDPIEHLVHMSDGPIFVCVPTPMSSDGACDTGIVTNVIWELDMANANRHSRTVVIKSTVVPGTTERLNQDSPNIHVCFNPEFLREATAIDDFKNQDRIIIGGPHAGTAELKQMYNKAYPDVPVTKTSSTIAEMVKYVTNCFLSTKVAFANEMAQICDKLEIDYDKVVEYATKDRRLGNSHWSVPGPMPASDGTGRFLKGFGGSCFIKDLNALMMKARQLGVDPKVMEGAWKKNLEVRPEKDWENLKGRAVI